MVPHSLGLYAFVQESQSVRQTSLAEPRRLCDPFFNLLEVNFEDFGGEVGDEGLCDFGVILAAVTFRDACWVAIAGLC